MHRLNYWYSYIQYKFIHYTHSNTLKIIRKKMSNLQMHDKKHRELPYIITWWITNSCHEPTYIYVEVDWLLENTWLVVITSDLHVKWKKWRANTNVKPTTKMDLNCMMDVKACCTNLQNLIKCTKPFTSAWNNMCYYNATVWFGFLEQ